MYYFKIKIQEYKVGLMLICTPRDIIVLRILLQNNVNNIYYTMPGC